MHLLYEVKMNPGNWLLILASVSILNSDHFEEVHFSKYLVLAVFRVLQICPKLRLDSHLHVVILITLGQNLDLVC